MFKKISIFAIIFIALLGLYFVYNYFTKPEAKAPTTEIQYNNFKGPTGAPRINGPTGPPPDQ